MHFEKKLIEIIKKMRRASNTPANTCLDTYSQLTVLKSQFTDDRELNDIARELTADYVEQNELPKNTIWYFDSITMKLDTLHEAFNFKKKLHELGYKHVLITDSSTLDFTLIGKKIIPQILFDNNSKVIKALLDLAQISATSIDSYKGMVKATILLDDLDIEHFKDKINAIGDRYKLTFESDSFNSINAIVINFELEMEAIGEDMKKINHVETKLSQYNSFKAAA
jgi:hypothetical protein